MLCKAKERRDQRIFELWLACHTQEEIAEMVGCPITTVSDTIRQRVLGLRFSRRTQEEIAGAVGEPIGTAKRLLGNGDDSLVQKVLQNQTNQAAADHVTDFEPPIYKAQR